MKTWLKVLIITLVIAIPAFLIAPNGPLGIFWDPHPAMPAPAGAQVPLFILLGFLEAITFGLAVSFLIFGYSLVKAIGAASLGLTRVAHLTIVWVLGNWWLHDSLHTVVGPNLNGLLALEYGFHVTLMISGGILSIFFVQALGESQLVAREERAGASGHQSTAIR